MLKFFKSGKSEALWDAAYNRDLVSVQELLNNPRVDPNWSGGFVSTTTFQIACSRGADQIVWYMLNQRQRKINFNQASGNSKPALLLACEMGHEKVVKMLLDDGRIDVRATDRDRMNALSFAVAEGKIDLVEMLLASNRDLVDEKDYNKLLDGSSKNPDISSLLKEFRNDPRGTRARLRKKLGYSEGDVGNLFALVVYASDGYFHISGKKERAPDMERFFRVTSQLPIELQMIICNRVFDSSRTLIKTSFSEAGFRKYASEEQRK